MAASAEIMKVNGIVHCYGNGNGRGGYGNGNGCNGGGGDPHPNLTGYSGQDDVSGHGRSYGLEDDLSSAGGSESVSQHFRKAG